MPFSCLDCDRYFKTSQALESHCDAKDHDGVWECCGKEFDSWHAWDQVGFFRAFSFSIFADGTDF